jgi:hypothetical protein
MPLTAACTPMSNGSEIEVPMDIGGLVEAEYVILYAAPVEPSRDELCHEWRFVPL